jgi:hypothetical protein
MTNICPICAFPQMPYAAIPYNICPCCGTEFGVDDHLLAPSQIRQQWIKAHMPWFDEIISQPSGWSPAWQLIQGGHGADLVGPIGFVTYTASRVINVSSQPFLMPLGVAA